MRNTVNAAEFQPGQVWAYSTRPEEPDSTLTIVKVETHDKAKIEDSQGMIVHICVQGVQMKNPHSPDGLTSVIGHLPCSGESIRESVTHLLQEGAPLPEYEEGYRQWRAAFDAGQAGIWGIPVARMVEAMEIVLNQSPQQAAEAQEESSQP